MPRHLPERSVYSPEISEHWFLGWGGVLMVARDEGNERPTGAKKQKPKKKASQGKHAAG